MNKGITARRYSTNHSEPGTHLDIDSPLSNSLVSAQIDELLGGLDGKFLQAIETCSFRLGDEILKFQPVSIDSNPTTIQEANQVAQTQHLDVYFIYQGRVRILCRENEASVPDREITAQLLETGGTFGADQAFCSMALSYRAVAASPVQIGRIPGKTLLELLEQFPNLNKALSNQSQQREALIFLRSYTVLKSLSSHQLLKLLPYLKEETIAAGSSLTQVISGKQGRFWLRSGTVTSQNSAVAPPVVGDSWGYPSTLSTDWVAQIDWVAQTDVRLYILPQSCWDTAVAFLPFLNNILTESSLLQQSAIPAQGSSPTAVPTRSKGQVIYQAPTGQRLDHHLDHPPDQHPRSLETPPLPSPEQSVQSQPIAFPKPARRQVLDWFDRYPWVEQHSSSDCGAACLAMIAQYWGKQFPLHILRELANIGRSGASLKSLANAAERVGFHARPVRASFSRIAEQSHPWIAHWEGSHYVVVYRIKGERVIVADPAIGRRSLSQQEFQEHWTGYALLLEPTERLQETDIKQSSLSRYLGALVPYRSLIIQIILFSVLIQVFGLVTPLFTQIILDKVVVQKSLTTLNVFAIGLVLFGIWSIGLSSVRQYLLSYCANRLDLTLISGFISHTLTLPLKFFESRRVGDIITRVQENQKIQQFLIEQVVLAWLNFLTGFIYLGLMLYYNWQLTLLVLVLIPPILLLTLGATPLLRRISREIFKDTADQNSVLVEMMTGVATIKSTATEREMRWRWEDHLTRQINTQFQGQKLGIGLQATNGLISSLGNAVLLWFGATLVIHNQLTIGQFVAFNMMLGYVISPVISLANLWDELQEVLISVERLDDVFGTPSEETRENFLLPLPPLRGEVQFEDVTFRYSEEEDGNTLQNISFRVQTGQTIAIVGRSGSGKTTLVKLLQGLYHPNRGRVTIDGHDIRHVSPVSLRSQLGVVPQECFLFSGTILENIALYRPEFDLERVIDVAKLAEAHAFIQSLPLGYSTKVGERGSALSGGQRQRIAIARALISDPQILILDEATSSLDTESERRFQRNLAQIRRNRTTFIIAHRLSTVRNADQILVLDRGILVEQGTHQELMHCQGLYHHLAQQQLDL